MNVPVKDRVTVPWISEREIPAIKLALSAWRKLRKDRVTRVCASNVFSLAQNPLAHTASVLNDIAWELEVLAGLEARIFKEKTK